MRRSTEHPINSTGTNDGISAFGWHVDKDLALGFISTDETVPVGAKSFLTSPKRTQ